LKIGGIRQLSEELRGLPASAMLPDWTHLTFADRFSVALQLIPAAEREAALSKSAKQLSRYSEGTEAPMLVVAALARHAELPLDFIVGGRAMPRTAPLIYIDPLARSATDNDVPVRKLAFQVSAGTGTLMIDDAASFMRFPRSQLEHSGVRVENARLFEAHGESMVPTINDGDLMLVDISDGTIAEGKVYVFSIGDEIFVKRLRRVGGKVLMRAENQELFPGEELVPDGLPFRLYGRVKWAGRTL
jgi:Peptidase S24-like